MFFEDFSPKNILASWHLAIFCPNFSFLQLWQFDTPSTPLPPYTHTYTQYPPSQEIHFCPLQNLAWPPPPFFQFLWKQLHEYFANSPSFLIAKHISFVQNTLMPDIFAYSLLMTSSSPHLCFLDLLTDQWSLILWSSPHFCPLFPSLLWSHLKWLCIYHASSWSSSAHCSLFIRHCGHISNGSPVSTISTSAPFPPFQPLLGHKPSTPLCPAVSLQLKHFPDPHSVSNMTSCSQPCPQTSEKYDQDSDSSLQESPTNWT